jgi:hypothetical protein
MIAASGTRLQQGKEPIGKFISIYIIINNVQNVHYGPSVTEQDRTTLTFRNPPRQEYLYIIGNLNDLTCAI